MTREAGITPHIIVLNIQVAALMTCEWVARQLAMPADVLINRVILPGYCRGDLEPLAAKLGVPVQRGPLNLHDLPELFGQGQEAVSGYGEYDIEIIAEINDAARVPLKHLLAEADRLHHAGADMIDLGCDASTERPAWTGVADTVAALRKRGLRVSIDSFHPEEVREACAAGAELVLSVNSTNCQAAHDWDCEVVAIPDTPKDLDSLEHTIESLTKYGVPFRLDPILEPIGLGFAASLGRFLEVRRRFPDAAIMMGIGNLTEMTEADSASMNALLIGLGQELGIGSVLTTEVINWARSSVREIDIARRLMFYAIRHQTIPKHLDPRLVMLRDPKLHPLELVDLEELASRLTDRNIRVFADAQHDQLHAMNNEVHAVSSDPFKLFDQLGVDDPSHAFYLGYEIAKAMTALTLGKNYVQDEPLSWGILTRHEVPHFERRKRSSGCRSIRA